MPSLTASAELADPKVLAELAARILRLASKQGLALSTAESCTGGMLASLLTDIEGVSSCFDRGFVVYSEDAKTVMLGIDPVEITRHGVVSAEIATAMATGALSHSRADLAVAITGFAGPGEPQDEEGLVYLCAASRMGGRIQRKCQFGPVGRDKIRAFSVRAALELLEQLLGPHETDRSGKFLESSDRR